MGRFVALAILVLADLALFAAPVHAQTAIEWSVHNRFRLFNDDDATIRRENQLLDALHAQTDIKSAYAAYYPMLRAGARFGKDAPSGVIDLYSHTRYNRQNGDYGPASAAETPYALPDGQVIDAHLSTPGSATDSCLWRLGDVVVAQAQCGAPVRISIPYPSGSFNFSGPLIVMDGTTEVASTQIVTSDLLILGMGDSYAAGEGSPDHPADAAQMTTSSPFDAHSPETWWRSIDSRGARLGALPPRASADWWSVECHRSLFSPQVIAALRIAADDAHRSVTFMSYSCAGAAVLDGLLTPQMHPPGADQIQDLKRRDGGEGIEGNAQTYSQLERAVVDLCAVAPGPQTDEHYDLQNSQAHDQPYAFNDGKLQDWSRIIHNRTDERTYPKIPVCDNWRRHPSLVFLTIGGNDIGFAGLGAWALTPDGFLKLPDFLQPVTDAVTGITSEFAGSFLSWNGLEIVCPTTPYVETHQVLFVPWSSKDPRCNANPDTDLNYGGATHFVQTELPELLNNLQDFVTQSGLMGQGVIVQEAYPSPMRDETGAICGSHSAEFTGDAQLAEPWLADRGSLPSLITDSQWVDLSIYIRPAAAQAIEKLAFDQTPGQVSLNNDLAAIRKANWILAAAPPEFAKHGICAGSGDFTADFAFPRGAVPTQPHPNEWRTSVSPNGWDPYKSRPRWLRTANDSLLTESVSVFGDEILPEGLAGTIHPTAEGQSAVADQLYLAARPYAH